MVFLKIITIFFIFIFSYNNVNAKDLMFENFDNQKKVQWKFITDQVMGGVSTGRYEFKEENKIKFLRMTGKVSLENNGGFIQVRRKVIKDKFMPFKIIFLNARGNNLDYYVHLRTTFTVLPWQYYQAKFNVSKNWKTFKLNLTDFKRSGVLLPNKINTNHIKSIALVAFGKEHEVELDVSNIGFIN